MLHDEILLRIHTTKARIDKSGQELSNSMKEYKEEIDSYTRMPPVPFYFEDVEKVEELLSTAVDFYTNGLLPLPYNRCLYLLPPEEHHNCSFFVEGTDRGWKVSLFDYPVDNLYIIPSFSIIIPYDNPYAPKMIYINGNYNEKDQRLFMASMMAYPLICTLSLGLPHYTQEAKEVGEKINRKRRKRGKLELQPYTIISLSREVKEGLGGITGTTKPYWRRGHIRRLSSGKVTKVRPHMVNFKGDHLLPQVYRVVK